LLLFLLTENKNSIFQELLVFHPDTSIGYNKKKILNTTSQQMVTFLKKNLHIHLEITCWIINKLTFIISNICDTITDITLQDIYFSILKSFLEYIPIKKSWYLYEVSESHSSEVNSVTNRNSLQIVLCLLSRMDLDTNAEIKFLQIIYPMLSKVYHVKDIELALCSNKNDKLFVKWKLFWNEMYAYYESATTLLIARKINESICRLTENCKILLCERELLKRIVIRRLHWLNDIFVSIVFLFFL